MNIVLCGMMGSGKTTVARALHELYGLKWVDTDEQIVALHGEIGGIFAAVGEEGFRDIESAVAARVARTEKSSVISLGGGCVLRSSNVEELRRTGKIFYLRTSPETVISRIRGDNSRPLLKGNIEERVRSISAARSAAYERAADYIVDTDGRSPQELAKIIMEYVKGSI